MNNFDDEFEQVESLQKKKYPLLKGCIKDGILYPELYNKSPLKIMIILKEPYDTWDKNTNTPSGGTFNFEDIIKNIEKHYNEGLNKTWFKVSAMAYALKNNLIYSENLTLKQVKEGLSCVCWINLSKTPWKTKSDVNDSFYQERVCDWESVVKKQFQTISSNIIFYGYTWDCSRLNPIFPNENWDYRKMNDIKMYFRKTADKKNLRVQICRYDNSRKILVNGFHPAFGNSASWQTEYIQDYINNYGLY